MDEIRCRSGRHVIKSSQDIKSRGCRRCSQEAERERIRQMRADAAAFRQLLEKPSLVQQVAALVGQHNLPELAARMQAAL
ncbi:Uncharacterised protein [Mycolicibacterium fortuitum]|uniref:Uncharacterized protein n=1 Tax=Mycolicibacterium fortuitum TaxID=1766 RepID=A0A378V2N0_MYCFO|nr:Uncharacterised protein [Mycolicibacterium fortuitum]